jgi:tRNA-binding protein
VDDEALRGVAEHEERMTGDERQGGPGGRSQHFHIYFGSLGEKTSSAQLRALYQMDDLVGRLVVAAVNLGSRNIAGFLSEVLVLGLPSESGEVVLLEVEREVPLGGRVY